MPGVRFPPPTCPFEPSCHGLFNDLLAVVGAPGRQPDHLCLDLAVESVQHWAACWRPDFERLGLWPLPVGREALAAEAERWGLTDLPSPILPGREYAIFARRLEVGGGYADVLGLVRTPASLPGLPAELLAGATAGGGSTFVVAGPLAVSMATTGDPRPLAGAVAKVRRWWAKHIEGRPLRTGRPALLSPEQKRRVLAEIIRQAEADGIPRQRLALDDAADLLDEWCERGQPVEVGGEVIELPPPLTDLALGGEENRLRRRERLREWLEQALGHRSWKRAKAELN